MKWEGPPGGLHFNFMNRFTDGLRLPPEDEAINIYREIYKKDFSRR